MSEGIGRQNIIILFRKYTVSFLGIHKWEPDIYIWILTGPFFAVFMRVKIIGNQTFILDSHRPFLCIVLWE
jgi:hypothetical protein